MGVQGLPSALAWADMLWLGWASGGVATWFSGELETVSGTVSLLDLFRGGPSSGSSSAGLRCMASTLLSMSSTFLRLPGFLRYLEARQLLNN